MVFVIEGANYSPSFAERKSYYDPESKTFHFFPVYYVSTGYFGQYEDTFEITDFITDGIKSVNNGQLTKDNAAIYNLSGQRLSKPQRGVNIIDGKKVVVR